jgi:hypothetical protein
MTWDASIKRWRTIWQDQVITLILNDDGAEDLETVKPLFEAALKLEPVAREHMVAWIERDQPHLTRGKILEKLHLFHLGCEADGLIWFLYKTGDLLARTGASMMVTLHDDGRLIKVGEMERS